VFVISNITTKAEEILENMSNSNKREDIRESPVKYESTLKISDMSTYTIKRYMDDSEKVEKDCLIFTGNEGLEGFVHAYQRFNNACHVFNFDSVEEKIELFEKILEDDALLYWNTQVRPEISDEEEITEEHFNVAIKKMKTAFGGGEKARDHIIEYMKSDACRKPRKVTVRDHARRMQAIMKLANEAEGIESPLNEMKFNKILLNSFPNDWKTAFVIGGGNISRMNTEELINHFSEVKIEFDNRENKNKGQWTGRFNRNSGRGIGQFNPSYGRNYRNGGRGRGFSGRNPGRGRGRMGRGPNPEMKCPLHPYANHKWKDCFENQRGIQFRPYRRENQRNGNVNFNQELNNNNDNQRIDERDRDDKSQKERNNTNPWNGMFRK
jgi:hypothetical protein